MQCNLEEKIEEIKEVNKRYYEGEITKLKSNGLKLLIIESLLNPPDLLEDLEKEEIDYKVEAKEEVELCAT